MIVPGFPGLTRKGIDMSGHRQKFFVPGAVSAPRAAAWASAAALGLIKGARTLKGAWLRLAERSGRSRARRFLHEAAEPIAHLERKSS